MDCTVGVAWGEELLMYSFPGRHPMNRSRLSLFASTIESRLTSDSRLKRVLPRQASLADLELFHTHEYVERVRASSASGFGYLDYGDTPSYPGVFEAASYVVGTTLECLYSVVRGEVKHAFNPVGGLHHSRPGSAAGFCVFNDASIAIAKAHLMLKGNIFYVDIDAHHGDGVYYPFEREPWLYILDVHEDGRYLYPGTGAETEKGAGPAKGTKLNACLPPGAGDEEFSRAFAVVTELCERAEPDLIVAQTGADSLGGDPITHLRYTSKAHRSAISALHRLAHEHSDGRLLALGGGGYDPKNIDAAWNAVIDSLLS